MLVKIAIDAASAKKAAIIAFKLLLRSGVVTPLIAAAIPTIKVQLSPPFILQPISREISPSYNKKCPHTEKEAFKANSGSCKKTKEKPAPVIEAKKDNRKKKKGIKKAVNKTPLTHLAKKDKGVIRTDKQFQKEAITCMASYTLSAIYHFTSY